MKIYSYGLCALFIFISSAVIGQTEKIRSTFFSAHIILQNGETFEGIIIKPKDSSFLTLKKSDFKYIKKRERTLVDIEKAMYEKELNNIAFQEFSYDNLGIVEVKKRKRSSAGRKIGFGIGAGFGLLAGLSLGSVFCEDGSCLTTLTVASAGIYGVLGLGVGSLFSIRIPQKKLVKEVSDKEWQEALLQYSILR
jgi:hypothetical protein